MEQWLTGRSRAAAAAVAMLCGTALLGQYGLDIAEHGRHPLDELQRLYGWFTIWCNSAVALIAGHVAIVGRSRGPAHPALLAASAAWIAVVGIIFNTLLAGINPPPTPLRAAIDVIFHSVAPVAWPLWWLLLRPPARLDWRHLWAVLPLPLAYCACTLIIGAQTGRYPYFFIDAGKLGPGQLGFNIVGLASLFAAIMAIAIWWDRRPAAAVRAPEG